MKKDPNRDLIIGILIVLIVVLVVMVVYAFVVNPINISDTKSYSQGANDVISVIFTQIQQQGFAEISFGNQTITLVPFQG